MTSNPPRLLPADLIEAQIATIDLLVAMFPGPEELEIPTSSQECVNKLRDWCESADTESTKPSGVPSSILLAVHAPIIEGEKTIQVNVSIPLHCEDPKAIDTAPPLNYTLRQPGWMSKAEISKLSASMPTDDIFAAFEYIREEGTRFLETQQTQLSQSETTTERSADSAPLVRVWFYFPSLSTREKRSDMVNHAPDYSLTGFVLAGKPGVLCLEGSSRNIDAYMSFIKTHSWGDIPSHQKKVSERYRETEGVSRVFGGMEEITDSLGERGGQRANRGDMQALEAWLKGKGLGEAFERRQKAAIDAAIRSGVRYIFYASLAYGGAPESKKSRAFVMQSHLDTELYLEECARKHAIGFTVVRQGVYNEAYPMYLTCFDVKDPVDEILIPHDGSGPGVSWVKQAELGEGNAELLRQFVVDRDHFPHRGKTVILSGARQLNFGQVVEILSMITGKQIRIKVIANEEWAGIQKTRDNLTYDNVDYIWQWHQFLRLSVKLRPLLSALC
ncbi:hypothetical protein BJX64DRAFT_291073 [Aspergillus heterothallicus]